jgi:hypothetical protein
MAVMAGAWSVDWANGLSSRLSREAEQKLELADHKFNSKK